MTEPSPKPATQSRKRTLSNPSPSLSNQKLRLNSNSPQPPIPSSTETINNTSPTPQAANWGFMVYRTTYSDEDKWRRARSKLLELAIEQWKYKRGEGEGDFEMAMLSFVEDEGLLGGKDVMDVRMIHNPLYRPEKDDEDGDEDQDEDEDEEDSDGNADDRVTLKEYGGLDSAVCIMIDEASMESILANDVGNPGYVIAIDSTTRKSEMDVEDWDGSMRIHVEALMHDFYLCIIKDGTLIMGEIHNPDDPEEIWIGH